MPEGALGRRRMPGGSHFGAAAGTLDHCVSGWRSRFFLHLGRVPSLPAAGERWRARLPLFRRDGGLVGSVIKKRRKRMAKKKHRKLLKKTRIQRRNKK